MTPITNLTKEQEDYLLEEWREEILTRRQIFEGFYSAP